MLKKEFYFLLKESYKANYILNNILYILNILFKLLKELFSLFFIFYLICRELYINLINKVIRVNNILYTRYTIFKAERLDLPLKIEPLLIKYILSIVKYMSQPDPGCDRGEPTDKEEPMDKPDPHVRLTQ